MATCPCIGSLLQCPKPESVKPILTTLSAKKNAFYKGVFFCVFMSSALMRCPILTTRSTRRLWTIQNTENAMPYGTAFYTQHTHKSQIQSLLYRLVGLRVTAFYAKYMILPCMLDKPTALVLLHRMVAIFTRSH